MIINQPMRRKLSAKKIGVVFGTFAPMHVGHVDIINQAKRQNDQALVVVSGTNDPTRDRGAAVGLHLDRRWRYAREVFSDDELTVVAKLDETNMPAYPNGWIEWTKALQNVIVENHNLPLNELDITLYVGEQIYVEKLAEYWPDVTVTLMDRSSVNISATQIREDPLKYWHQITKPFKRHFTKKVLVVGSASGGKSTLVKDLARFYDAPYSPEYAREYQLRYNVRDEELDTNDYVHLLTDQYQQTADIIDSGTHNGIVFADTNSTVTRAYIDYYLKDEITLNEYKTLVQLHELTESKEDWDIIFLVLPQSNYVDDGTRDMGMADESTRDWFTQHLMDLLEPFNNKVFILGENSTKENFFHDNYQQAKSVINDIFKLNF